MTEKRSKLDYYAGKAGARKKACGELDEALANLAALEQRASAAAKRLEETERAAQEELDARVAEIEREHQEATRRARALATERVHAARSEHGNAAALLAKAQRAAEEARARLLRLVPSGEELSGEAGGASGAGVVHVVHVSIEKQYLVGEIRRLGLRAVLKVPDDVTEDEMVARIEGDPRTHFVLDPACDQQNDDGTCAGHDDPGLVSRASSGVEPGETQEASPAA